MLTAPSRMEQRRAGARRALLAIACGLFVLGESVAAQAEPTASERASAQALFDQGRALVREGKCEEAIPKLEESERLDPGTGTALNLATCYEKVDRLASAWSLYIEVAAMARATGQSEREQVARERASALEPKLSRLLVSVPPAARAVPGLEVLRDGQVLGTAQWDAPIPVDPGEHVVAARAPGHAEWQQSVAVGGSADKPSVEVPVLTPSAAPKREPAGEPQEKPAAGGSTQRIVALSVGGLGVAALGTSVVLGIIAKNKHEDAIDKHCQAGPCDRVGYDQRGDAVSLGNAATVVASLGAAAVVGGAVLWFTAPRNASAARVSPRVHSARVGVGTLVVEGAW